MLHWSCQFSNVAENSQTFLQVRQVATCTFKSNRNRSVITGVLPGGAGELPYEEYTGVCHELGSYFQEKIPKRVCQFFTKPSSGKGYNICKKFQIGSVILMTQMTNQKKTELIDFFDQFGLKIHNFWKNF